MVAVRDNDSEPDLSTFGRRVRFVRLRRQLSQADLAVRIKRSRQSVNTYESENTGIIPPKETIKSLAKALGVSEEFLAYGTGSPDTKPILISEQVTIPEARFEDDNDTVVESYGFNATLIHDLLGGKVPSDLTMYVLTHDAVSFNLCKNDRVMIDAAINSLNHDHGLWLVRSSEGYEIVRVEHSILARRGEFAITTGSGQSLNVKPSDLDVVGPILTTLHAVR